MKKFMTVAVFLMSLQAAAFAAEINGTVESMNVSSHQIVIIDAVTGQKHTIGVHPNVLTSLQAGSKVIVSVHEGSNTADTISVEMA